MEGTVTAVSRSPTHTFSKPNQEQIKLVKDYGVEGDAHAGRTVKHRYLAGKDPSRPNILQVHLIEIEVLEKLETKGFKVKPGELGENITTQGIDFLELPSGTILRIGEEAAVELTALRSPCKQIDAYQKGLQQELTYLDENSGKAMIGAVMGIVRTGGVVQPGDSIGIELPPEPHQKLVYTW